VKEKANVSRIISVLVLRSMMCLEKQSAPGIGLPEFCTHDLKTRTEMVLEMLAFSSLDHLTRLVA
jgi:hypothetical protein